MRSPLRHLDAPICAPPELGERRSVVLAEADGREWGTTRAVRHVVLRLLAIALFFGVLAFVQQAEAGCGSYIQFRGSPGMAANPVARLEHAKLELLPNYMVVGHTVPDSDPPCQGPHCSRQRVPLVPPALRLVLVQSQDVIPLVDVARSSPHEFSWILQDGSYRPHWVALDLFRPPRSL